MKRFVKQKVKDIQNITLFSTVQLQAKDDSFLSTKGKSNTEHTSIKPAKILDVDAQQSKNFNICKNYASTDTSHSHPSIFKTRKVKLNDSAIENNNNNEYVSSFEYNDDNLKDETLNDKLKYGEKILVDRNVFCSSSNDHDGKALNPHAVDDSIYYNSTKMPNTSDIECTLDYSNHTQNRLVNDCLEKTKKEFEIDCHEQLDCVAIQNDTNVSLCISKNSCNDESSLKYNNQTDDFTFLDHESSFLDKISNISVNNEKKEEMNILLDVIPALEEVNIDQPLQNFDKSNANVDTQALTDPKAKMESHAGDEIDENTKNIDLSFLDFLD